MNEDLTFKKPESITTEQAATVGVGVLVRYDSADDGIL